MKVRLMPCRTPLREHEWPMRLEAGIKSCGDDATIGPFDGRHDAYVVWGLKRHNYRMAVRRNARVVIVERAYLGDRYRWLAVGIGGLNGYANFCNDDVPPDRWDSLWRPSMRPWVDRPDGYALVIGQVPGDASLHGIDPYRWAVGACLEAKARYGRVLFRPHPCDKRAHGLDGVDTDFGSLEDALAGARVVITYSSNVAVDAVMAGVPAVSVIPGSMAWTVTSHSIGADLFTGDREDWGRRIAYAQWAPEELSDGSAWRHIRQGLRE